MKNDRWLKLHTQKFWISHKNTSGSRATHSRWHESSYYSIFNMLELPALLPEMAVVFVFIFLPHLCPMEEIPAVTMTSAPREVPQEKAALGAGSAGTPSPAHCRIVLPTVPPGREWTQSSCPTSLTSRCSWEAGKRAFARRGFILYLPFEMPPSLPTTFSGKKKLKLNLQGCRFFFNKTPNLLQTVKSCFSKGKNKQACQ